MKKEIKYSQAIEELNQILGDLETEKIDVDEVSLKVKRAIELIKFCKEKIKRTEWEVKRVIEEFEKDYREEEE
ncbi:MAG: exodeoxyribonuclease VII small subunit [Candidatus Omnitrophota bacterium]|nr:MAG: exodeoxyribonuclease VII small subunit [Candidatus Omnitrophota bacterium]